MAMTALASVQGIGPARRATAPLERRPTPPPKRTKRTKRAKEERGPGGAGAVGAAGGWGASPMAVSVRSCVAAG